jgi:hypothetical protein
MRGLTICQPYADMIRRGDKPIENRTWSTQYRGLILVHAGQSLRFLDRRDRLRHVLRFGAIVATANLVACLPKNTPVPDAGNAQPVADELARRMARQHWIHAGHGHLFEHPTANGPWCWILEDVRQLDSPIDYKGAQGLWRPLPWLERRVRSLVVLS